PCTPAGENFGTHRNPHTLVPAGASAFHSDENAIAAASVYRQYRRISSSECTGNANAGTTGHSRFPDVWPDRGVPVYLSSTGRIWTGGPTRLERRFRTQKF